MSKLNYCPKSPRGVDPPHCLHDLLAATANGGVESHFAAEAVRFGRVAKICCWCGSIFDGGDVVKHGPHQPSHSQGRVTT